MTQASAPPPPGAAPVARPWRRALAQPSLSEVFRSIPAAPRGAGFWRKLLVFIGPGYLIAVGYMDPGNWATDLAGGSAFGYTLLSVVLASSLAAIVLQTLAARLGIATGRDLAQACRDHYSPPVCIVLWLLCEAAICACDLAELIGSAIALKLLFHIPLLLGVCLTTADVLALVALRRLGFRYLEAAVMVLMASIGVAFFVEVILARPEPLALLRGFVPQASVLLDPHQLYIAIGILGATVMPHNLYLHSSIVQTRRFELTLDGRREAARFAAIDSTTALVFAMLVNAAILIVAAAVFHRAGRTGVAEIEDAYRLLSPLMGAPIASVLFALALLASGQNSTLTATLAAQIVMEGFVSLKVAPWIRRLITRLTAAVPAIFAVALWGDRGASSLLIFSQVLLCLQLPFAVIPLVLFTGDRAKMGALASGPKLAMLAWTIAALVLALNLALIASLFQPL
jgi:manganese transport protein